MNHKIHLAIQIIPLVSRDRAYGLIDHAIDAISRSGVTYFVGPMETVLEGTYDEVLSVAKQAQQACIDAGAEEMVVNMKIHTRKDGDITWMEKMKKYSGEEHS
jgi:uncharacterized protein YqgV (UPF0045/DUF77 family)